MNIHHPYLPATLALAALCAASSASAATESNDEFYPDMNRITVQGGYMFDMNDSLSVDNILGTTLSIGYTFNEDATGFHTVSASVGLFQGESDIHTNDGEQFETTQSIVPLSIHYAYHYKISSACSLYAGAHGGALISKIENEGVAYCFKSKGSVSKANLRIGLDFGANYKISKRWLLNAGISFDEVFGMYRIDDTTLESSKHNATLGTVHIGFTYQY